MRIVMLALMCFVSPVMGAEKTTGQKVGEFVDKSKKKVSDFFKKKVKHAKNKMQGSNKPKVSKTDNL